MSRQQCLGKEANEKSAFTQETEVALVVLSHVYYGGRTDRIYWTVGVRERGGKDKDLACAVGDMELAVLRKGRRSREHLEKNVSPESYLYKRNLNFERMYIFECKSKHDNCLIWEIISVCEVGLSFPSLAEFSERAEWVDSRLVR